MNQAKRRRREYRRLVVAGDLHERVRAAAAGSTNCSSCGLVHPVVDLVDGVCVPCRPTARPQPPRNAILGPFHPLDLEPDVVYVDASWENGVAGLAIVGALGERTYRTEVSSSVGAECLALRRAMNIARDRGLTPLMFRTDCTNAVAHGQASIPKWADWTIEWVPRNRNAIADRMATAARLAA